VIAHLSAEQNYCFQQSLDQIRTIEFARTNFDLFSKIDWTVKVGVMGHSMGGRATIQSVSQEDIV
jgi:hypothetical protein